MTKRTKWDVFKQIWGIIEMLIGIGTFLYGVLKHDAFWVAIGGLILAANRMDEIERDIKALQEKK